MSDKFVELNKNAYDGNGWSKYQLMVLQQLDDHNKVLQNLNKELTDLKQLMAVSQTEERLGKAQSSLNYDELAKKVTHILYDEKGLSARLNALEREVQTEEKVKVKLKAYWALIGAILAFVANSFIKFFELWK